ncbi:hypothetical protein ABT126_40775 [Streptomyces sp. NPDC002012]|nr:hypothetical protein OG609_44060 [Streptomyces sp. NBC_01224]
MADVSVGLDLHAGCEDALSVSDAEAKAAAAGLAQPTAVGR